MVSVCFVCLGNICRSPTAEGIFLAQIAEMGKSEHVTVDSAGTGSWHIGQQADPRSRHAAEARGYQLLSRARSIEPVDFQTFDFLLAMDRSNYRHLVEMARTDKERAKVHLLRDFDPNSAKGAEVPDPYSGGADGFEIVLDICEAASRGFIDHLVADGRL